jgi:arylsulfatase A-like enzyme
VSDPRSTILISVDRLRAAYLGCYGNTWIATPALNRLATESFLFDEAHAAGLELANFFHTANNPRIFAPARRAVFMSDDAEACRWAGAAPFDEVIALPPGEASRAAEDIDETHVAGIIAAAMERLDALAEKPFLFWLHLGALGQTWDAPREFRERYHEEDDAPLPEFVAPPVKLLDADFDPDERWGYALAYAAQVSALDANLDPWLEHLRASGILDRAALMLVGARGYPLGEHRRVGQFDGSLYAESLHVPWIVRLPGGTGAMERSLQLVNPRDIGESLAHYLNAPASIANNDAPSALFGAEYSPRERLAFQSPAGESALRTPEWFLRRIPKTETREERIELYAKPDDRWEINDVHDRCVDVVEELSKPAQN